MREFKLHASSNERWVGSHNSDFEDCDRLVANLRERFGRDSVLPITNFNTFKLKSLLKDMGRLYGIPFDEVNALTSVVEAEVKPHVIDAGENKSLFELRYDDCMRHSQRFRDFMAKYPEVAGRIKVLYKQNKALGCHASGVIIADDIDNKMPVIATKNGPQTPWVEGLNYKHLGDYGFVKFDLLGLDTLRIIRRCIELILFRRDGRHPTWSEVKAWYDQHLHPDKIDFDDQRVYENVYHAGKWAGIFQFTSPGAQRFIRQFEPRSLDDIAVATALYRPGPLAAKFDAQYLRAKKDPDSVVYDHPAIKEVLGFTHGTVVFQEQLMALGNKLAGMSMVDCDRLRKAIVKRSVSGNAKNKGEIVVLEETFIEGSVRNGLAREKAQALFEVLAGFASYAFNASLSRETLVDTYKANHRTNEAWPKPRRKKITNVKPGELVRSRDETTGREILVPVVKRHNNGRKKVVKVTLKTGETVTCTWNHKFRTVETGEMLPLKEIVLRDLSIVVDKRLLGDAGAASGSQSRTGSPRRTRTSKRASQA